MATVHVIGAGISGLAAATALAGEAIPVKLYEASSAAGGRCRSSKSVGLGTIDHGLHVIGGEYSETFAYLDRIQARDTLIKIKQPYRFANLLSGTHWGLSSWRPFPAASLRDYLAIARLLFSPGGKTLGDLVDESNPLYDEWVAPFARMLLHTPPDIASAAAARKLLWKKLRARKGAALYLAQHSLAETFITPALTHLDYHGGSVYFSHALTGLEKKEGRVTTLNFARKKVPLAADDIVILATPPAFIRSMLPEIPIPTSSHSAITLHFATGHREPIGSVRFLADAPMDFIRYDGGIIRTTIRIADHAWYGDQTLLAARIWKALQHLHPYLRSQELPEWAIWREKRAGHQVTNDAHAPITIEPLARCFLAGDWLDPTQPASIESAASSGHKAAAAARERLGPFTARRQSFP